MNYPNKIVTTSAVKKVVLLLTAGIFTLTSMAQNLGKFVGEWKLNQSRSESVQQFPLCLFGNDRLRSRVMKIAAHPDFLTVDVASEAADGTLLTRQEKLIFDRIKNDTTFVGRPRERSTARWTADGQTMTVTSVRSLDLNGHKGDSNISEAWKLSNDGKSIYVEVTSITGSRKDVMKLVYDRQMAVDYRF